MHNLLLFPAAKSSIRKNPNSRSETHGQAQRGSLRDVTFSLLWNVYFFTFTISILDFFTFTNSPSCSFPGYSQSVGWFEAFATLPGVLVARWIQLVPLCLHLFVWSLLESSQCPWVTAVTSAGLGYELHFIKCHAEVLRHWCTAY